MHPRTVEINGAGTVLLVTYKGAVLKLKPNFGLCAEHGRNLLPFVDRKLAGANALGEELRRPPHTLGQIGLCDAAICYGHIYNLSRCHALTSCVINYKRYNCKSQYIIKK